MWVPIQMGWRLAHLCVLRPVPHRHQIVEDAARGSGSVRGLKCVMSVAGSAPVPCAQGTAGLDRQRPN